MLYSTASQSKLFLEMTLKVTKALKGKIKKYCSCRLFRIIFASSGVGLGHGTKFGLKGLSYHCIIPYF